jgi:hypothetical protein
MGVTEGLRNLIIILGGVIVIVIATGPKVCGFKPGRRRWVLMAIKIRITTSVGREVMLSAHVVRFYGMLKIS